MRCEKLFSNVDLLPTLLELAGMSVSDGLDGHSFLRVLTGKAEMPRNMTFAEHTWGRRAGLWYYTPARCLRTDTYKFIHNFLETPPYIDTDWLGRFGLDRTLIEQRYGLPAPRYELYDLATDPMECTNLTTDPNYTHLCKEFERCLMTHLQETGDLIVNGFAPNKGGHADVPLWERQDDASYRLRAYHRAEGSDVPIGE